MAGIGDPTITNFLLDHSALVPLAMLLLALVCAGVGYLTVHRPRIPWVLVVLSLLPVRTLTLTRSGVRMDIVMCTARFSMPTQGSVELLATVALSSRQLSSPPWRPGDRWLCWWRRRRCPR